MSRMLSLPFVLTALLLTSSTARSQGDALSLVDAGTAIVAVPPPAPRELSGLVHSGGAEFYAVSDSQPGLHPLSISIDPANGTIRSVKAGAPIVLRDEDGRPARGGDLEGVAFDQVADEVLTVNESFGDPANAIVRYRRSDWRRTGVIDLSGTVFLRGAARSGFGLESLASTGSAVWTANEEALDADGPRATGQRGTTVRLTRFDRGQSQGQWAYVTEPSTGALPRIANVDGVADLLALPGGQLLVLERATYSGQAPGDFGGFVSRIFEVTVTEATDISSRQRLDTLVAGTAYMPVRKRLLWQRAFSLFTGVNNFEGIALGPTLDDGSRSVLLIADNDVLPSTLWALRLLGK